MNVVVVVVFVLGDYDDKFISPKFLFINTLVNSLKNK